MAKRKAKTPTKKNAVRRKNNEKPERDEVCVGRSSAYIDELEATTIEDIKADKSAGRKAEPAASLDDIGLALQAETPEPNTEFLAAQAQERADLAADVAHLRDADGGTFDKLLHLTDDEGQPKLTKKGLLRKRRRRAAKRDEIRTAGGLMMNAEDQVQARTAGVVAGNSLILIAQGLGGEEWNPKKDVEQGTDERLLLQTAFGDYFVAKGVTDFPPGIALVLAVGMYAAPRFTQPQTQSKIKNAWIKTKDYLKRMRERGAQSGIRHNGERKDDTSAAARSDGEGERAQGISA